MGDLCLIHLQNLLSNFKGIFPCWIYVLTLKIVQWPQAHYMVAVLLSAKFWF